LKALIFCAPLLTYFYVCSATVLENQGFSTQASEMSTDPKFGTKFCDCFVIVLMRGRILLFDFIVSYVEDIVSVGIAKKFL
ncbi:hypothetical protein SDB57_15530, partial [Legionella pneumophila serogroup 1]